MPCPSVHDAALVTQCRSGHPAAFEPLVRRYQNAALAIALTYLQNRQDAQDMVQEAFIDAYWRGLINYHRTSKAGYLIASSLVEQAVDVVVAKRQKKHQGMHWCHRGADGICALRTVWLNGEWERYWQTRDDDQAA